MQVFETVKDEDGHALTDKDGIARKEFAKVFPFVTKRLVHICGRHGEVFCEVAVINGEPMRTFCPICEAEIERESARKEAERQKERERLALIARYEEMNIEKEYWNKTLTGYEPLCESQKQAKAAVGRLIERKHGKVILLGVNGCGKTHLGACAVKALGGKVLTMYEITTMIRQSYSPLAKRSELEIVGELATVPMLFIDEMGRTKGSAAELNWLSYILDKRHQRGLPFMLGTNSHLMRDCPNGKKHCEQCFENFLGNDILSRLGEDSEIVKMYDAPDYRRRKKTEEGVF